jgi:perosamine synthetase
MIPIYKPFLYEETKALAIEAIESGYIAHGPNIELFEQEFAQYCGRKYGVTCSNGTVALYIAIKALNLPKKSEVVVPSMTIVSCLTAIVENDLVPVFCDVDPLNYNVDFDSLASRVNSNTSAVLLVDTYGLVLNVDKLHAFNSKYPHIKVIEDASEAHGAFYKNNIAGSLGDISVFSFFTNKIVTTGEGGMVLTDDVEIQKRLMSLRNLHFTDRAKYIHSDAGFNFRMTNIQCAIGRGQLMNIEKTITERKRVAYLYNSLLGKNSNIQLPYEDSTYRNVYWYYSVLVKKNYKEVLKALKDAEIDYRHFFYPLHKQPFINSTETLKISEECFENGILLPIFNELSDSDVKIISDTILNAIQ